MSGTKSSNNNNHKPSLKEYTAFHGMLCGPVAARRCIQSFEGGVCLFASQEDYDTAIADNKNLADFDFNNIPNFSLNLFTYYVLVLMSLTGFCSALRFTRVIEAIEYGDSDGDEGSPGDTQIKFKRGDNKYIESSKAVSETVLLRLPPEALEYVFDRSYALGPMSTKDARNERTNTGNSTPAEADGNTTPELTLIRRFEYDFGGFLSVLMLHFTCTNGRTHLIEIYRPLDGGTKLGFLSNILMKFLYSIKSMIRKIRPREQPADYAKKSI